jgi:hypothetical protein
MPYITKEEKEARRNLNISQAIYVRLAGIAHRRNHNLLRMIEDALIELLLKLEAQDAADNPDAQLGESLDQEIAKARGNAS